MSRIVDQAALAALRQVQHLTSRPVTDVVRQNATGLSIDSTVMQRIRDAGDLGHSGPTDAVYALTSYVGQGSSLANLVATHRSAIAAMRSSITIDRGAAVCHTDLAERLVRGDVLRCVDGKSRPEAARFIEIYAQQAAKAFKGDAGAAAAYASYFNAVDGSEAKRDCARHFGALIALCAGNGVTDGHTIIDIASGKTALPQLMNRAAVLGTLKLMEQIGFHSLSTREHRSPPARDATNVYPSWSVAMAPGASRWFV
jgi:hypothetical protein